MQSECVESLGSDQYHELLAERSELLLQASEGVTLPDAAEVCERENRKYLDPCGLARMKEMVNDNLDSR